MPGGKLSRMSPGGVASEVIARTWSIQFPGLGRPISIVPGPARTLAAHFAGATQNLCECTRLLARPGNPCDAPLGTSGITRSPHQEEKQGKNMSDKATKKATAATSEAMGEVFHEAMRSYEKALKSGIRLQEESVNLWKELFSRLGSPLGSFCGVFADGSG
jgi:hypothetical protein